MNANDDMYAAYGGDIQFKADIASALLLNESSVSVESSEETSDEYLIVTYSIDVYSDDTQTLT